MKKFLLIALVAFCSVSCELIGSIIDDIKDMIDQPTEIYLTFDESDESRVATNEDGKLVWSEGDKVSFFNRSNGNSCWALAEQAGYREGIFTKVQEYDGGEELDYSVVLYPYNEQNTLFVSEQVVHATIPGVQKYVENGHDLDACLMVASGTGDSFALKDVCGRFSIYVTGSKRLVKISLACENGAQMAGKVAVNYADSSLSLIDEGLLSDAENVKEVVIETGEGIQLDEKSATRFCFILAQTIMPSSMILTMTFDDGTTSTQRIEKLSGLIIKLPVIGVVIPGTDNNGGNEGNEGTGGDNSGGDNEGDDNGEGGSEGNEGTGGENNGGNNGGTNNGYTFVPHDIPSSQIWYKSVDGEIIEPATDDFGANIISNSYKNGKGIIHFDGPISKIGNAAFRFRERLIAIGIPLSVESIGAFAFDSTNITDFIVPHSVKEIPEGLFDCVGTLERLQLHDDITRIGRVAFNGCERLLDLDFPDRLEEIGNNAFSGCKSFRCIKLPYYVRTIGSGAFDNCTGVTNVVLGESVESIGYKAFDCCTSLVSINIPNSVKYIAEEAFMRCSSLKSIIIPRGITTIKDSLFEECHSLEKVELCDDITVIQDEAFKNCKSLTKINLPYGVTKLGYAAFRGCESLPTINLPGSISTIENHVFNGCSSLDGVVLPDGLTTLAMGVFTDCKSLTKITIPYGVTKLEGGTFKNCAKLAQVELPNSVNYMGNATFYGCASLASIELPSDLTEISQSLFYGCSKLERIDIPYYLKTIGESAFYGCTSLSAIDFPNDCCLITIGKSAFYGCTSLKRVILPDNLTTLGGNAFFECRGLEWVTLQYKVTEIGKSAFSGCTSLKEVECKPQTPPTIGATVFNRTAPDLKIYIHVGALDAYRQASGWSEYADAFVPADFQ